MPELPEVETTCLGIKPHLCGATIESVVIRNHKLRWPIPDDFEQQVLHQTIQNISRRGKYLCFYLNRLTSKLAALSEVQGETERRTAVYTSVHEDSSTVSTKQFANAVGFRKKSNENMMLIHLGMSGRLSLLTEMRPPERHDHVDILFANGQTLRYTDPRRFGTILLSQNTQHPLLDHLGIEPLSEAFTAEYLFKQIQSRKTAIKPFLMNNKIVVGIGNIYATEALFLAKIHPAMPVNALTLEQATRLVEVIKHVLTEAILNGGTTLKDFLNSTGKPGYFSQKLKAYGRANQPCITCGAHLKSCILGQRATVFCPICQS